MKYAAYNHNGTVLGIFDTPGEAAREASDYTHVTGNASYTNDIDMCKKCSVEPHTDPVGGRHWCDKCLTLEYGEDCITEGCEQGTKNESGVCDDCLDGVYECESCQGTGIDMHAHNSTAPKDVGKCKLCKGEG